MDWCLRLYFGFVVSIFSPVPAPSVSCLQLSLLPSAAVLAPGSPRSQFSDPVLVSFSKCSNPLRPGQPQQNIGRISRDLELGRICDKLWVEGAGHNCQETPPAYIGVTLVRMYTEKHTEDPQGD